jgi:hypothetical protein
MPSSVRRIWLRKLSLDPQSERTRQMRHLLRNRLPRQVGTTSRPRSLTTYLAKPRNDWRAAEIDQVDESGVGKNRRRISRRSAKAASIMDIVAGIVDEDEDGAVEDTEVEATVETANQNVVVVAIEDVVMHKQVCSNCTGQTSKAARRIRHSLHCIKSFSRFAISVGAGQNQHTLALFRDISLLGWEIILEKLGVVAILCVKLFFSFFSLQLVPPGSRTRTKKSRSDEYDRIFLALGWQLSGPIIRNERMD